MKGLEGTAVKHIIVLTIICVFVAMPALAAQTISSATTNHREKVRDFNEYIRRKNLPRDQKGIEQIEKFREAWARAMEKARVQFALTRQKEDPRAEERREMAILAEAGAREKAKEKLRQRFVMERDAIRDAVSKLPQIDEMVEYGLVED